MTSFHQIERIREFHTDQCFLEAWEDTTAYALLFSSIFKIFPNKNIKILVKISFYDKLLINMANPNFPGNRNTINNPRQQCFSDNCLGHQRSNCIQPRLWMGWASQGLSLFYIHRLCPFQVVCFQERNHKPQWWAKTKSMEKGVMISHNRKARPVLFVRVKDNKKHAACWTRGKHGEKVKVSSTKVPRHACLSS